MYVGLDLPPGRCGTHGSLHLEVHTAPKRNAAVPPVPCDVPAAVHPSPTRHTERVRTELLRRPLPPLHSSPYTPTGRGCRCVWWRWPCRCTRRGRGPAAPPRRSSCTVYVWRPSKPLAHHRHRRRLTAAVHTPHGRQRRRLHHSLQRRRQEQHRHLLPTHVRRKVPNVIRMSITLMSNV